MKNAIKWIFFIILIVVFAIDVAGFWKYKLKKDNNVSIQIANSQEEVTDVGDKDSDTSNQQDVKYNELTSKSLANGQKIFITNIKESNDKKYTIQGAVFEQYEITKDEYNKLKSGNLKISIFGIEYYKEKLQSNNLMLTSTDKNAENLYIKYDTKLKKYILKDATTDYVVYKQTDEYVQTTVSGELEFDIIKNGKTNKSTVEGVAKSYNNVNIPKDTIKVNLSELSFNKKGVCTKITETDV